MKISKALSIVAVAWGVALSQASPADDVGGGTVRVGGDKPVVEKLLEIMLESGQLRRSQYEELLEQSREEQAAAVAAVIKAADKAETPPVESGPKDWKISWSNGFKVDRNDGAFKLKFGGRIQTDATFMWPRDGLRNDFEAAGIDPKDGNGVEFRRARLFFEGTVYERLFFKAQYEFANTGDGKTDFKDVFMGLKNLGPVGDVRLGHFKERFMLQEMTSSKYITFMERGLNNVFFPGRNVGVMATGSRLEKKLLWQVGLFRNTNDQGFVFDDWGEGQWDVAGRLAGVPFYADDGGKLLHLGVAYIHQFRDKTTGALQYKQRPEAHLAQYWVDTQSFGAGDSDLLNLELSGVWGPFSVQSEWTSSWVNGGPGQIDTHFWGMYAFASYFLTGEQRHYELGKGKFGRVKPKANFSPANGDWGAWEIAARYSYLDLNDENIAGGKLWDLTVGINWYLYPNLRVMWNYIHGKVDDRRFVDEADASFGIDGSGDLFEMRFQIDF